jgi:hypothetical protein
MEKRNRPGARLRTGETAKTLRNRHDVVFPDLGANTELVLHIDELLKIAGATNRVEVRSDLVNALRFAQAYSLLDRKLRQRAPRKLVEQFEESVRKTVALLGRLNTYPDSNDTGMVTYPVGTGVIDIATTREMMLGQTLSLPRQLAITDSELLFFSASADRMIAAVNIEPLLRGIVLRLARRKRRRSQPEKLDKQAIVFYAYQFFSRHSRTKASTDPNNPFRRFVERFHAVVAGDNTPGGLDWHIRTVLKQRRAGV